MAFDNEIIQKIGGSAVSAMGGYKITLYPTMAIIEGHKGLSQYSPQLIKLRLDGKNILVINGQDLVIKNSCRDEIIFVGNVDNIQIERN